MSLDASIITTKKRLTGSKIRAVVDNQSQKQKLLWNAEPVLFCRAESRFEKTQRDEWGFKLSNRKMKI